MWQWRCLSSLQRKIRHLLFLENTQKSKLSQKCLWLSEANPNIQRKTNWRFSFLFHSLSVMVRFHSGAPQIDRKPHASKIVVEDPKTTIVLENQIILINRDEKRRFPWISISGYFGTADIKYHSVFIPYDLKFCGKTENKYQYSPGRTTKFNDLLLKMARGVKELVKMFILQCGHSLEKAPGGDDLYCHPRTIHFHKPIAAQRSWIFLTGLSGEKKFSKLHVIQGVQMKKDLSRRVLLNNNPEFPSSVLANERTGVKRVKIHWVIWRIVSVEDDQKKLHILHFYLQPLWTVFNFLPGHLLFDQIVEFVVNLRLWLWSSGRLDWTWTVH